jgi:transcriptional regulator with XRE-family HTH domain
MQTIKTTLALNLKRLRKERSWIQTDLAKAAGLSPDTIAKLESEAIWIGADTVAKLAKTFGVPEATLFSSQELAGSPSSWMALRSIAGALGFQLPAEPLYEQKATSLPKEAEWQIESLKREIRHLQGLLARASARKSGKA